MERTRISVQVPDPLLELIDNKCLLSGLTRSQFILSILSGVFDTEQAIKEALPDFEQRLIDVLETQTNKGQQ